MSVAKVKMLKQNIDNVNNVLSHLEDRITPSDYEKVMDSDLAKEGVAFFNFELGVNALRTLYGRYTYLFMDMVKEAGLISRHYRSSVHAGGVSRVDPVRSLIATLVMKDIDDLSFEQEPTSKDVNGILTDVFRYMDVPIEAKADVRREVRNHMKSHTFEGRYYSRRTKLVVYAIKENNKTLYSVK
tara:strand:- start:1583 stop:2137 length:555 start_codon:yes stop_codon:yes gene_type:complete